MRVKNMRHPDYLKMLALWKKYRIVFEGGKNFIDAYLQSFGSRESAADYNIRRSLTYAPAHAKAAIMEIKNAVFQRMPDIKRGNGTPSYVDAVVGKNRGVDLNGNTMNGFIGRLVLPDLLSVGKIGIYIDRHPLPEAPSKVDVQQCPPYLYTYAAEDILSWAVDPFTQELISLLLHDTVDAIDPESGLVIGVKDQFRLMRAVDNVVEIIFYDNECKMIESAILDLPMIPFVILELSHSLLTDIADHQIALLNLASSDINYAIKGNFPFYTEQFDPISEEVFTRQALDPDTVEADASIAKNPSVRVGVTQGRRYPKGLDAPSFIAPPIEPLTVSMQKQEQIKSEIQQLVNLAVSTLKPARASAESKREDQKGLEAGLSYIGLELEFGERCIEKIWAMYEQIEIDPSISYPQNYSIRTEESRRREAKDLLEFMPKLPSRSYQKEMAKEVAEILLGHRVTAEELVEIRSEIDTAKVIVNDPEILNMDFENGFVSAETASAARLYPVNDVEIARKEHAERLARIAVAQSSPNARGVDTLDPAPEKSASEEKRKSRQTDEDDIPKDKTRGKGK